MTFHSVFSFHSALASSLALDMDSQAEPEAVGGGAGAHAAQALAIHLKCKNVTVDFDPEHTAFVRTMLSLIVKREKKVQPVFPCDSSEYLVAGDLINYLISCLAATHSVVG